MKLGKSWVLGGQTRGFGNVKVGVCELPTPRGRFSNIASMEVTSKMAGASSGVDMQRFSCTVLVMMLLRDVLVGRGLKMAPAHRLSPRSNIASFMIHNVLRIEKERSDSIGGRTTIFTKPGSCSLRLELRGKAARLHS